MHGSVSLALLGWCLCAAHGQQQEVAFTEFVDLSDPEYIAAGVERVPPALGKIGNSAAAVVPLPDGVRLMQSDGTAAPELSVLPYPPGVTHDRVCAGFLFEKVALVYSVGGRNGKQGLAVMLYNGDGTQHSEMHADIAWGHRTPRTAMCDLPGGRGLLVLVGHELIINTTHVLSVQATIPAPIFRDSLRLQYIGNDVNEGESIMFKFYGSIYVFRVGASGGVRHWDGRFTTGCAAFGGVLSQQRVMEGLDPRLLDLALSNPSQLVRSKYNTTLPALNQQVTCSGSGDGAVLTWVSWPDFPVGNFDSLRRQRYATQGGKLLPSGPIFETKVVGVPMPAGGWRRKTRATWVAFADVQLEGPPRFGQLLVRDGPSDGPVYSFGVQEVPADPQAVAAPPIRVAGTRPAGGVHIFTSWNEHATKLRAVSLGAGWVAAVLPNEEPFTAKFWREGRIQRVTQLHGAKWACVGRIGARLAVFHDCVTKLTTSKPNVTRMDLVDPVTGHVDTVNLTGHRVLHTCQRDDGRLVAAMAPFDEHSLSSQSGHIQFVDFTDAGAIDWRSPIHAVDWRFTIRDDPGELHCLSDRSLVLVSHSLHAAIPEQMIVSSGASNTVSIVNTSFSDQDSIACSAGGVLLEVEFSPSAPGLFDLAAQVCTVAGAQLLCTAPVSIGSVRTPPLRGSCSELADGRIAVSWLPMARGLTPPDELWRMVIRVGADKQVTVATPPASVAGVQPSQVYSRPSLDEALVGASTLFTLVGTYRLTAVWINTTVGETAVHTTHPTQVDGTLSPSPAEPPAGDSGPSSATAVLIAAVVLAALGGAAVFVAVRLRRRRKRQQAHTMEMDPEEGSVSGDEGSAPAEQCWEMEGTDAASGTLDEGGNPSSS